MNAVVQVRTGHVADEDASHLMASWVFASFVAHGCYKQKYWHIHPIIPSPNCNEITKSEQKGA